VKITFDPEKRIKALLEREVDFSDVNMVIENSVFLEEDTRKDYGEKRMLCFGLLRGRLTFVGYVNRGKTRHVFSMRKANAREQKKYLP
jgi:uncharacterized protein